MAAAALDALTEAGSPPGSGLHAPLDRIRLSGITAYGHHGVFDFEREQGQRFVVDVVLTVDLSEAERTDDLASTVDYGALASRIVADVEGEPLDLIEALAGRIASTCLAAGEVGAVEVTVHKPDVPLPVDVADVAVTLTRRNHS